MRNLETSIAAQEQQQHPTIYALDQDSFLLKIIETSQLPTASRQREANICTAMANVRITDTRDA